MSSGRPLVPPQRRIADGHLHLLRREVGIHLAVAAEVAGEDDRVDLTRIEHGLQDPLEVPEVHLPRSGEIDGVRRDDRRRDLDQPRLEAVGQLGQLEPGLRDEVGRDDSRASAVSDDRHPAPTRPVWGEARERTVDELLGCRDAEDLRRPAGGLDRSRVACKRASVRGSGTRARFAATGGEQDDLLPCCDRCGTGPREGSSVTKVLAVDADHARVLVGRVGLDELRRIDVGLVAERGEARDSDAVLDRKEAQLRVRDCRSAR